MPNEKKTNTCVCVCDWPLLYAVAAGACTETAASLSLSPSLLWLKDLLFPLKERVRAVRNGAIV